VTRTIYRERIPSRDPRLRRNVHHDSESRRYALDTTGLTIADVEHTRHIPIFDQGQLGDCVTNSGLGTLGTGDFYAAITALAKLPYPFTNYGCTQNYIDLTQVDDVPGYYKPGDPNSQDTGSDGLSEAKLLKSKGVISGYQHTFTLEDALKGLTLKPFTTGIEWTEDMFTPDAEGIVHPTGQVAGGHQITGVQYISSRGLVGFDQSWGAWGLNGTGRFYIPAEEYGELLARNGDVTFYVAPDAPAPTPSPAPAEDADQTFAGQLHAWLNARPCFYRALQRDASAWLVAKHL
jgi:hypothetical protein